MTSKDGSTTHDTAAKAGLALLLGGGVAEAMSTAEATLVAVQSAAALTFAGLARVQATGAAVSAVPPVAQVAAAWPQEESTLPTAQSVRTMFADSGGVAARAAPMAAFAPAATQDGAMATEPAATVPAVSPSRATPTVFASFAPAAMLPDPSFGRVASSDGMQSASPGGSQPAAPDVPAEPAWTSAAPKPQGAASVSASATPSASAGPTGGDVYLDGMRVGSWLADHLAREAGRPQGGGTAFDPRLTPAWPGTLQGG